MTHIITPSDIVTVFKKRDFQIISICQKPVLTSIKLKIPTEIIVDKVKDLYIEYVF